MRLCIASVAAALQVYHLTEAVHELAGAHAVEEANFLMDDMLEQPAPQPPHNPLCAGVEQPAEVAAHALKITLLSFEADPAHPATSSAAPQPPHHPLCAGVEQPAEVATHG